MKFLLKTSEEIKEQLRNATYCATIEVTGRLTGSYRRKIIEAIYHHEVIRHNTEGQVDAGIIFTHNRNGRDFPHEGLDFINELKSFDYDITKSSLENISNELEPEESKLAEVIEHALREGEKLQNLLFPNKKKFEKLQDYLGYKKGVPRNKKTYIERIGNIKGRLLEEYIKQLLQRDLPHAKVHRRVRYDHYAHRNFIDKSDVDVLVIGDEKDIRSVLTSKDYFVFRRKTEKN